jgi:putative two-component system response regulator
MSEPSAAKRPLVLVVDDADDSRTLFAMMLKPRYDTRLAASGTEALFAAKEEPRPDLILLDVVMPDLDGYEVCRRLKADPGTAEIPVIFVTSRTGPKDETWGLRLGAADFLTKPINASSMLLRIAAQLALRERGRKLENAVAETKSELHRTRRLVIRRLARALEYREGGLTHRVARITNYVKLLSAGFGAPPAHCELLAEAAPLYDVGKIGVPEAILCKAGPLSASEWKEVRRHPEIGANIIGEHKDSLLAIARVMALTHHERWDGTGYPAGLEAQAIPWPGRIMALADAFEAMTSTQRHREAVSVQVAASRIVQETGKQFDPQAVDAFKKQLRKMIEVKNTIPDELEGIHDLDFTPETAGADGDEARANPATMGESS